MSNIDIDEIRRYITDQFNDGDIFRCVVTGKPYLYREDMLYREGSSFYIRLNESDSGVISVRGRLAGRFTTTNTPSIEEWRKEFKNDKRKETIEDILVKNRIKNLSKQ